MHSFIEHPDPLLSKLPPVVEYSDDAIFTKVRHNIISLGFEGGMDIFIVQAFIVRGSGATNASTTFNFIPNCVEVDWLFQTKGGYGLIIVIFCSKLRLLLLPNIRWWL